jgi:hypothetical protein
LPLIKRLAVGCIRHDNLIVIHRRIQLCQRVDDCISIFRPGKNAGRNRSSAKLVPKRGTSLGQQVQQSYTSILMNVARVRITDVQRKAGHPCQVGGRYFERLNPIAADSLIRSFAGCWALQMQVTNKARMAAVLYILPGMREIVAR